MQARRSMGAVLGPPSSESIRSTASTPLQCSSVLRVGMVPWRLPSLHKPPVCSPLPGGRHHHFWGALRLRSTARKSQTCSTQGGQAAHQRRRGGGIQTGPLRRHGICCWVAVGGAGPTCSGRAGGPRSGRAAPRVCPQPDPRPVPHPPTWDRASRKGFVLLRPYRPCSSPSLKATRSTLFTQATSMVPKNMTGTFWPLLCRSWPRSLRLLAAESGSTWACGVCGRGCRRHAYKQPGVCAPGLCGLRLCGEPPPLLIPGCEVPAKGQPQGARLCRPCLAYNSTQTNLRRERIACC